MGIYNKITPAHIYIIEESMSETDGTLNVPQKIRDLISQGHFYFDASGKIWHTKNTYAEDEFPDSKLIVGMRLTNLVNMFVDLEIYDNLTVLIARKEDAKSLMEIIGEASLETE